MATTHDPLVQKLINDWKADVRDHRDKAKEAEAARAAAAKHWEDANALRTTILRYLPNFKETAEQVLAELDNQAKADSGSLFKGPPAEYTGNQDRVTGYAPIAKKVLLMTKGGTMDDFRALLDQMGWSKGWTKTDHNRFLVTMHGLASDKRTESRARKMKDHKTGKTRFEPTELLLKEGA